MDLNLNLWLKADTGLEEAAADPAEVNDDIQFWRDMSAQSNDAFMNTAGNRPSYDGEAVVFDGSAGANTTGEYMDIPDMDVQTIFAIIENTRDGSAGGFHSLTSQAHSGSSIYLFLVTDGAGYTVSFDGTSNVTGRFGLNGNAFSGAGENVGLAEFPNERTLFTGEWTNSQANMTYLCALDNGPGPRYYPNFQLNEIMFYDTSFTTVERCRIESYPCLKHGVEKSASDDGTSSIDERDYLSADSTVIWDFSVDSVYSNDIAGIGRDDSSALDKRTGLSRSTDGAIIMEKSTSFSSNKDFLIWGNDNGSRSISNTGAPSGFDGILERTWRVNTTGTPGTVTVSVILSQLGFNVLDSNAFALVIDSDSDFSSGASLDTNGVLNGDTLVFSNISFSDGDYFTLAGPEAVSPAGIAAGLNLWLKYDVGVEEAASDPAEFGDGVAIWQDQSGLGNDATQTVAGDQPIFRDTHLEFTGSAGNNTTGEYFDIPDMDVQTLVFVVDSVRDGTTGGFQGISGDATKATQQYFFIDTQNSYVMSFDGQGSETSRYGLNGSAFSAKGENVGTGDFPADDQIAFAEYTSLQTDWAYIGAMNTGGTPNYRPNLNMKEMIIYDQNMTSVERARLESYLHIKYDISRVGSDDGGTTIDERDYLASDSTVIWDYSANSAFDDMIAGLGRDDISSLYDTIGASVDGDVLQIEKEDSIQTNKQFFVWGHNNRIVDSWRVVDTPAGIQGRIARIWKAQETDDLDTLKLVFDLSQVYGPGGNGGNDLQFVRLLIDTDTNFAAGATIINSTIFNNTTDLVEFDYAFDGTEGYFFSLGSTDTANAPLNL